MFVTVVAAFRTLPLSLNFQTQLLLAKGEIKIVGHSAVSLTFFFLCEILSVLPQSYHILLPFLFQEDKIGLHCTHVYFKKAFVQFSAIII